ncbi:hypothetical protein LguiA_005397 [Lonicera macranthoides]
MALPPTSEYRGVAASIPQPANHKDIRKVEHCTRALTSYNKQGPSIVYRNPIDDQDIVEAVYRWDIRPYAEVFRTGFLPEGRGSTSSDSYYNLEHHVNGGEVPLGTSPADGNSAFVSTTRLTNWRPILLTGTIIYRYEIFAPGGIDTVLTLRENNKYPNQQEIAFPGGIARQYIRSARPYIIMGFEAQVPTYSPYGNRLYRNGRFNPNPSPDGQTAQEFMNHLRNVRCPTREEVLINVQKSDNKKDTSVTEEPYVDPCCNVAHYFDCAFNFNDRLEAFLFTTDHCLQLDYIPGSPRDYIVKGPISIGDFFPSLKYTIFSTGIDAAFTSSAKDTAYIFRSNIYAVINFVSGNIIEGPKKITDGFYYLKDTIFEHGIDAAFASHRCNEVYLFKGNQYARINLAPGTKDYFLTCPMAIALGFNSLQGTVFEDGIDAAYRAKAKDEAYIFKGDTYALINYAPGCILDYIIRLVTPISSGFRCFKGIIPKYPCGC